MRSKSIWEAGLAFLTASREWIYVAQRLPVWSGLRKISRGELSLATRPTFMSKPDSNPNGPSTSLWECTGLLSLARSCRGFLCEWLDGGGCTSPVSLFPSSLWSLLGPLVVGLTRHQLRGHLDLCSSF